MSQIRCRSKTRAWLALATAGCAELCSTVVHATALGAAAGGAILGQPLDVQVPARLGASEALASECVNVDVQLGDRHLPPSQVLVEVESDGAGMAYIRLRTRVAVDEPVVALTLVAACGNPVSKRYLVLADPPELAPRAAVPLSLADTAGTVSPSTLDIAAEEKSGSALPLPTGRHSAARALIPASAVLSGSAWRAVALRQPAAAPTGQAMRRTRPASRAKLRTATPSLAHAAPQKPRRLASPGPRLRLDVADPLLNVAGGPVEQALLAVAQAAAAAGRAASAASAAADRIASLEHTVEQLRGEVHSNRGQAAALRDPSVQSGLPLSTWLLGGAAVGLGLLAGWLSIRLSAARRSLPLDSRNARLSSQRDSTSAGVAQRLPTAAAAFGPSDFADAPMNAARVRPAPAWPPPAPPDGWLASEAFTTEPGLLKPPPVAEAVVLVRSKPGSAAAVAAATVSTATDFAATSEVTRTLAASPADGDGDTRDVSIDELLDIEQQAEFFVVLGQDDAAIELLGEHLRHTGGSSPLPYLKLLEIHRRRGSRSDYERVRARFNHRFNAYAPEWEVDLQSGLALDAYAGALSRLEQVWSRPQDSMTVLEAMLFRKSAGDLFDLPAYREVLFLYALARDLLDREPAETGQIDVPLPLSSETEFSCTSPTPFTDLGREAHGAVSGLKNQATGQVDFDLSLDSGRPVSIFDPLEETPPHAHGR